MKNLLIILFLGYYAFVSCTKSKSETPIIPTTPVTGKTYSADEITAFKQLTINEIGDSLVKLPAHVSVYLVDTTYPYITLELDSIISEINTLLDTNLVISRTTNRIASTIQVYLTDRDTYLSQEPSATNALQNSDYTGYAYIDWDDYGVINHGSAFVDMSKTIGDTLQQRYLMHHEIMHSLGLIGHVTLSQFSTVLFTKTIMPYLLDYTSFDKKMMLLLYNPNINPGMQEAEFDVAVKNL